MWNQRNLSKPPECTLQVSLTEYNKRILNSARKTLKKTDTFISGHIKVLTTEKYVLGRMIYKLSNQFRSEKSMRGLKQIKACLNRLDEVDVIGFLSKVYMNLFDGYDATDEGPVFLPSRQMHEFALVRIMGTAGLLMQTSMYSRITYVHAKQNMELGNMIPQNMIIMSLTARIWLLSKSMCSHLCKCYNDLVRCLGVLRATPVSWLPADETLPVDLDEWIKIEFGDCQSEVEDSVINKDLTHLQAASLLEDTVDTLKQMNNEAETLDESMTMDTAEKHFGVNEDIGVPIKRNHKDVVKMGKLMKRKMAGEKVELDDDIGKPIKRHKGVLKAGKLAKGQIMKESIDSSDVISEPIARKHKKVDKFVNTKIAKDYNVGDIGEKVKRKHKNDRKLEKSGKRKKKEDHTTQMLTALKKQKYVIDDEIVDIEKSIVVQDTGMTKQQKREKRKERKKKNCIADDVVDIADTSTLLSDTHSIMKRKNSNVKKKHSIEVDFVINLDKSCVSTDTGEPLKQVTGKTLKKSVKIRKTHGGILDSTITTGENINDGSKTDVGQSEIIVKNRRNKRDCVQSEERGKPVTGKTLSKQVQKYFTKHIHTLNDLKQFKEELLMKQKHSYENKLGVDLNKKQKRKLGRKIDVTIEKEAKKSVESEKGIVMNVGKAVGRMMQNFAQR